MTSLGSSSDGQVLLQKVGSSSVTNPTKRRRERSFARGDTAIPHLLKEASSPLPLVPVDMFFASAHMY